MVIPREPCQGRDTVETIRELQTITKAYLLGVLHDATVRKYTYRVSQKSEEFVRWIANQIKQLGYKAWTYQEGKNRTVYIVEFSKSVLKGYKIHSRQDKIDYIRGYFDTDGGIAKNPSVRFYIYFCQKDLKDLKVCKQYLADLKINCGTIHNPSKKADPNYWRFYIKAKSYVDFAHIIGSWHPDKQSYLHWMKR